ncbi:hypothetical protein GCM10011348_00930 [Marinobacterium nitratireducens]|uniref:Uncharacterized protein n=1 Tax=Marinobacterium nitratireducens TaxID=518897 RepID=A0A918DPH9_9GAMM|nr:hypothetical protein [Marinobacterium nitratireducens]GGO75645.1 hypothetical protein GCM10011348_00930 [Marinobacterium nitratireducens]
MSTFAVGASRLGPARAPLVLYLPNPPVCPAHAGHTDVAALVAANGNHWRKILTILAKLAAKEGEDWRHYRDASLLTRTEAISFADSPDPAARRHLVAGKASWQRLGFDYRDFAPLDESGTLFARDDVLLTPYPDYRQFPNRSIERVREWLQHARQDVAPG